VCVCWCGGCFVVCLWCVCVYVCIVIVGLVADINVIHTGREPPVFWSLFGESLMIHQGKRVRNFAVLDVGKAMWM